MLMFRLRALSEDVKNLESIIRGLKKSTTVESKIPITTADTAKIVATTIDLQAQVVKKITQPYTQQPRVAKPSVLTQEKLTWVKENWTGVLGMTILVCGLVFGQIYLSIHSTPILRFTSLMSVTVAMLGGSLFLRKKYPKWKDMASWVQSGGGAILLLATCGSSYFDALKFYDSPQIGLFIFLFGIAGGLINAWLNPLPLASSFSAVLNFIAISLTPSSLMIFGVAFLNTFAALLILLRHDRNWHSAPILIAYSAFTYFWPDKSFAEMNQLVFFAAGIGASVTAIAVSTRSKHRLANYSFTELVAIATGWLCLMLTVFYWSDTAAIKATLLLTAGAVAFYQGHKEKTLSQWRHLLYQFICLMSVVLGTFAFAKTDISIALISTMILIEVAFFTLLVEKTNSEIAKSLHYVMTTIATLGFAFSVIFLGGKIECFGIVTQTIKIILSCTILGLIPLLTRLVIKDHTKLWSIAGDFWSWQYLGILAIGLVTLQNGDYQYFYLLVPIHLTACFFYPRVLITDSLTQTISTLALTSFAVLQICIIDMTIYHQFLHGLMGLAAIMLHLIPKYYPRTYLDRYGFDIWVYGVALYTALVRHLILKDISSFLPGVALLILALLIFEFRSNITNILNRIVKKSLFNSTAFVNVSILYLWLFVAANLLVHLQSQISLVGYLNLHTVIGAFGVLVGALIAKDQIRSEKSSPSFTQKLYDIISTSGYESSLIIIISLIAIDVPVYWQIIGFAVLSLATAMLSKHKLAPKRINMYAKVFLIVTGVHLAIVSSDWNSPIQDWYAKTHITGAIGLVILLFNGFVLQNMEKSKPWMFGNILPIFIVGSVFFYWRFELTHLTMIYVMWAVVLAATGFYFKDKLTVNIAFSAIGLCVVRLIFYDMHQTDMLLRALVFISVGALMLAVQTIYKKYSKRLQA